MNIISQYIQAVLVFLTPLLISLTLIPVILSAARKYKLYDHPDHDVSDKGESPRKIHSTPTPRLGGIAIVLGYFAGVSIWGQPGDLWRILIPSLAIFFIGLRDDIKHIPARIRLALQIIISIITVYTAGLEFKHIILTPWLSLHLPYWAGFIFSIFILTGAINAINMVDGLDGLAGGLVLIAVTLLGYLFFLTTNNTSVFIFLSLPMIGAILGFLRYNTYPSSIFMGDGGSNWLGFMVGATILMLANSSSGLDKLPVFSDKAATIPFISILLCLAIPIVDTGFVLTARILKGQNPATPDKIHFHHGLMKIGLSHPNAVKLIYFISLVIGVTGFFPIIFSQYSSWTIPYFVPVFLLILLFIVLRLEQDAAEKISLYQILFLREKKKSNSGLSVIFDYWQKLNQNILFVILLAVPVFAGSQSIEVGIMAGIAFVLLLASHLFHFWRSDFIDIFFISMGAVVLLVANNAHEVKIIFLNEAFNIHSIYNIIFIVLSLSISLFLILTFKKQYLLITPTDFLMLIIPLLLLLVPQSYASKYTLNLISLRSIVLFLSLLTVFKNNKKVMDKFRITVAFALFYVFLTGALGMKIVY